MAPDAANVALVRFVKRRRAERPRLRLAAAKEVDVADAEAAEAVDAADAGGIVAIAATAKA